MGVQKKEKRWFLLVVEQYIFRGEKPKEGRESFLLLETEGREWEETKMEKSPRLFLPEEEWTK